MGEGKRRKPFQQGLIEFRAAGLAHLLMPETGSDYMYFQIAVQRCVKLPNLYDLRQHAETDESRICADGVEADRGHCAEVKEHGYDVVVVMEDVRHMRVDNEPYPRWLNRKLATWMRSRIQRYVEYKANWMNIKTQGEQLNPSPAPKNSDKRDALEGVMTRIYQKVGLRRADPWAGQRKPRKPF